MFFPQVTVAGFEPLLKFAYTSKLLFSADNVAEIRNSASVLGFRDLEEACFDFFAPKFSDGDRPSPFLRKTCCKKKCKRQLSMKGPGNSSKDVTCRDREVKPVADSSSQQEVSRCCDESANGKTESRDAANEHLWQCPKYRRQLACERETCKRYQNSPAPLMEDNRESRSKEEDENHRESTSSASILKGNHNKSETRGRDLDEIKQERNEMGKQASETRRDLLVDKCNADSAFLGSNLMLDEGSSRSILDHCPLKTFGEYRVHTESLTEEKFTRDLKEDKMIRRACGLEPIPVNQMEDESGKERQTAGLSVMEREVAEHLARRLGSDLGSSNQTSLDLDARSSSDTGTANTPPEWLNLHLTSKRSSCSLFPDLDRSKCPWRGLELSECEGASHSGLSSFNSGEDGDSGTETEADSESYTRERAKEVGLMSYHVCV